MSDTKNIDLSKQNCLIIISSTTGDGEQPESALPFLKKLRSKEIREKGLKHLSYTILGLGDSNYSQFCNGPKDIHKKLLLLGAKTFYEPGWADDGVGLEIVVEPWIEKIWTLLAKYKTGEMPMNGIGTDVTKPNVDLNFTKSESLKRDVPFLKEQFDKKLMNNTMEELVEQLGGVSIKVNLNDPLKDPALPSDTNLLLPSSPSHFLRLSYLDASDEKSINIPEELSHLQDKKLLECTLKNAKKLSKTGSVKDCYQVTLEFAQENGKTLAPDLEPGDAVDIICSNPRKEVDTLLKRLGLLNELADKACTSASLIPDCKKSAKIPIYLPKNGKLFSLRHILSNSVEIHSVPKKPFIRMLVDFTSDPLERRRLEELCSRQGGNNYLSVIRGNNICLLDLLLGFPSCQPPIERILEHLPAQQARPYSVCSWSELGQECDMVFSVVDIPQSDTRRFPRKGISTGWLQEYCESRSETSKIMLYKRNKKSFAPPSDLLKSFVMIGAGTGVAPFRGFLQKRKYQHDCHNHSGTNDSTKLGKTWLIFGCRDKNLDFIYKDEMEAFKECGTLTRLDCAFSRENSAIKYVQDVIKANSKEVMQNILEDNALVYVCGDALNMAKDVQEAIIQALISNSQLSESDCRKKIADMRLNDEYLQDLWG